MTQQILDDLHSLVDQSRVWRAICASIRFHASNRLWFSERYFQFTLTAGRGSYAPGDGFGLPGDLVEIVGNRVKLWYGGDEGQSQGVEWLSNEEFDLRREWDSTQGTPDGWTYDGRRLKLTPTPNSSTDVLTGPYVTNIGVPKFRYNSSTGAYDFLTPEGATLAADYTNDWFQWEAGEPLIRFRAMHELAKALKDPDADAWLASWLEARGRLEDETDSKVASGMDHLVLRLL
jgi:hypothetical protein